jgi:hypothetical protein
MACVASVLTTFSDETLTLIIEDDGAAPTETAASVEASVETVEPATPSSEPVTDPAPTEPVSTEVTGLVEDPLSSIPDETFTEALSLLICAPELLGEFDTMGTDVATASAPEPVMETGPADTTAADEPTETTTG